MVELAPANVGRKNWVEVAVRVATVTLIGPNVAPVGTVTVSEVVEAAVTVAFTAPKNTVLFAAPAAAGLKFVPVIVTAAPAVADAGLMSVIVGWAYRAFRGRINR